MIDKLIMRIIIEEHKYAAADVKDVLKGIDALENVEGYVSVNYVGYFYNTDKDVRDCVFILPKVLLEDNGMSRFMENNDEEGWD